MAAFLGELAARLTLDDKGYSATMGNAGNATKSFDKSSRKLSSTLGVAVKAIGITAAAVAGVGTALLVMGKRAGQMEGLSMGFKRSFGDMTKSLDTLRKASQGTVSDFDLMQSANKAALLGVTSSVDDLSGLMQTARIRGREMGLSMTQAFDDIVTGIGRGSPLILDNLGIKIPGALKESMKAMSDTEKTQALLNFAIKDGAKLAKEYGDVQLTSAEKIDRFKAAIINLKDSFAELVSPLAGVLADKLADFAISLKDSLPSAEELSKKIEILRDRFDKLKPTIARALEVIKEIPFEIAAALGVDLAAVIETAKGLFVELKDSITEDLQEIKESLKETFTIENIRIWYNTFLEGLEKMKEWVDDKLVKPFKKFYNNTLKPILEFWKYMIDEQIIPAWEDLKETVSDAFGEMEGDGEFFKETLKTIAKIIGVVLVVAISSVIWMVGALIRIIAFLIKVGVAMKKIANTIFDKFIDKVAKAINKVKKLVDWFKDMVQSLKDIVTWVKEAISQISGLGLSGTAKATFNAIKGLLGFASGGSFTVGGGGGTDSQLVAFKATPGERVTIETPQQQASGGKGITIQNLQIGSPNDLPMVMSNLNWLMRRV